MKRRVFVSFAAGAAAPLAGCTGGASSQAEIRLSSVEHPETVAFDEEFTVSVTVKNEGDEKGESLVGVRLAGEYHHAGSTEIDPGRSATESVEIDAEDFEPGTHELALEFGKAKKSKGREIRIVPPDPPEFVIDDVSAPDRIERGGSSFVDVTISNRGEQIGRAEVMLSLGGESVDTEVQRIHSGSTGEVRLFVRGNKFDPGDHHLGVSVGNDEVERPVTVEWPNPWGTEYVEVAATEESRMDHDVDDVVREALQFWQQNLEKYTDHQLTFDYQRNAADPDIQIRFTNDTSECNTGSGPDPSGCAKGHVIDPRDGTLVVMKTGYPRDFTVNTVMHEIGHVLGLDHGDEPVEVMSTDPDEIDLDFRG